MVPPVTYYLVGSNLRETSTHDVDVVAVLPQRDVMLAFGYDHEGLMRAYKEEPHTEKFRRYLHANKVAGWALSPLFPVKVDFKWILPTMLYNPHALLHLEADVTMYL